ncbi:hypothetical protein FQN50_008080 [Emmonsiellopsis sp. PD_5]|nr:hypothetical protein FQN50_008080 [Emmonsiellopsis sp. PD_5]
MEQESNSHLSSSSTKDDGIAQSPEQEVHAPAPTASFHILPNELVYHVFSMLPLPAAAALGLTCKPMWALFNSQHNIKQLLSRADRLADRLAFLGLIEDQFPNHLICHFCGLFHLRPAKRPSPSRPSTTYCDLNFRTGHIYHHQPQLRIRFQNAQEVMNAHRFGPAHGVPPSTLTRTIRNHHTVLHRTATIANGDLLLMTDAIAIKPTTSFDNWIYKAQHDMGVVNKGMLYKFLFHFFHARDPEPLFLRCPTCGREARASIKKYTETETETKNYEEEIRETLWCNLGPCRSPPDLRWDRAKSCPEGCSRAVVIATEAELRYVGFFDDRSPARFWEETGGSGGGAEGSGGG